VNRCSDIRDLFGPALENEAGPVEIEQVHSHVAECSECAELFDAMKLVIGAGDFMEDVEPPPHLEEDLSSTPCRRWLGLLYQAVDREISPANLDRLLTHLEDCPTCRQVWHDLTLVHQVGEAMVPPNHLLSKCISVRDAIARIPILGRRTATAAAYILALVTSLAIGNPTIIAQDFQAVAAEKVSRAASGVSEVAADGRGEFRVLMWRAMQWGEQRIDTVRGWVDQLTNNDDTDDENNDITGPTDDGTSQGDEQ
jgi:predicted anti-sigma-YlaC factor YlaD